MKPRTKLEKLVVELSSKLPAITEAQKKWAFGLFPINGFYLKKGEIWCQCCGYVDRVSKPELAVSMELESHVCPQCGKLISITHLHEGEHYNEKKHVSFLRPFGGWNVIRTFEVGRINNEKGNKTEYQIEEIYQNWIDGQGKEIIVTRPYTRSPFHMSWNTWKPMEIGHHNYSASGCYELPDMFDTYGNFFYPRANVTELLKRNGWQNRFLKRGIPVAKAIIQLLVNPTAETLVKQGQMDVFRYMLKRGDYELPYRYALNICHRNGYIIKDASMWFDYMDMLGEFNLDTHNAYYVCPLDLKQAHDRLMEKKRKLEEKEKLEWIKDEESKYHKDKAAFLGICFEGNGITISVLQSVKEFYEEGKVMHHCVFSNEYFKRKDSLILSARIGSKRIETVEVNLKTFSIVQSRGVCNKDTEYHDSIVKLVNNNMNLIRKCLKKVA